MYQYFLRAHTWYDFLVCIGQNQVRRRVFDPTRGSDQEVFSRVGSGREVFKISLGQVGGSSWIARSDRTRSDPRVLTRPANRSRQGTPFEMAEITDPSTNAYKKLTTCYNYPAARVPSDSHMAAPPFTWFLLGPLETICPGGYHTGCSSAVLKSTRKAWRYESHHKLLAQIVDWYSCRPQAFEQV